VAVVCHVTNLTCRHGYNMIKSKIMVALKKKKICWDLNRFKFSCLLDTCWHASFTIWSNSSFK